jgi:hypothetical protein
MTTTLHAFGCSHTFGQFLPDITSVKKGNITCTFGGPPSKLAWPQLVADQLDISCANHGHCGASRPFILHQLLGGLLETIKPGDIVCVLWPYLSRSLHITEKNWTNLQPGNPKKFSDVFLRKIEKQRADYYKYYNQHNQLWHSSSVIYCVTQLLENKSVHQFHQFTDTRVNLPEPVLPWVNLSNCVDERFDTIAAQYPRAADLSHAGVEAHRANAEAVLKTIKNPSKDLVQNTELHYKHPV